MPSGYKCFLKACTTLQAKREKMEVEIERSHAQVSGIMSSAGFGTLELSAQTSAAIAELGHTHMTEVQARTIPPLLLGRDVLGAAKTGQPLHHHADSPFCSNPWKTYL